MLIFDVPEVKLFLLIIAEIVLYLISFLCNRKNKDMYIRLFKVSSPVEFNRFVISFLVLCVAFYTLFYLPKNILNTKQICLIILSVRCLGYIICLNGIKINRNH